MKQQSLDLPVAVPSLPKQGGTIATTNTTVAHSGATGELNLSISCPVTQGRGLTPSLNVDYQTSQGNGPFGVGWRLSLMAIRLDTKLGTPRYDGYDRYLGLDGEVLEAERDKQGLRRVNTRNQYGSVTFAEEYEVTRYFSRVSSGFERYEHWQETSSPKQSFWLVYEPNGTVHCLGKSAVARTQKNGHIAQWAIEETCSAQGEHIYYSYQSEDEQGVDCASNVESSREHGAGSYLTKVLYGNTEPDDTFYCLKGKWPEEHSGWLFSVILDYGERQEALSERPKWQATKPWRVRKDPFSDYHYGFELRYHRLCHQMIVFHHVDSVPLPVRRLVLTYDDNSVLSSLISSQVWGYGEENTTPECEPARQYAYYPFELGRSNWQTLPSDWNVSGSEQYQWVDLYGEGVPGLLYREGLDWRYRAPCRAVSGGDDVEYSEWQKVSKLPSLDGGNSALMDMTGTGRLDWLVLNPGGVHGYFSLDSKNQWQDFIPFDAFPNEYMSGQGVFADLTGSGLLDIAVIGPRSVRLYRNNRVGFEKGEVQTHLQNRAPLPIAQTNARTLTAFSDVLGSGQSHFVEVSEKYVRCWPNLGHGQFGDAITIPWPGVEEEFQPKRMYLVDVDGCGASDLLYASKSKLTLFRNHAGNAFSPGVEFSLPNDVNFDDTCSLSFADRQGTGGMQVLLTVPHQEPAHYLLTLSELKPYLLYQVDNQCGAVTEILYRHSGQEWLDEKVNRDSMACALPISLYLVKEIRQKDNITGRQQEQNYTYRQGLYDPTLREFRGYAYVESLDTTSSSVQKKETDTPPIKVCRWFHVGRLMPDEPIFWDEDQLAYVLSKTQYQNGADKEKVKYWAERALFGRIKREEVYGLDGTLLSNNPYSVRSWRYQVTLKQDLIGGDSAVMQVLPLETLSYNYERVVDDPAIQHELTLSFNEAGLPLHQVEVHYPRRQTSTLCWDAIYPSMGAESIDDQQYQLRLHTQRYQYYQEDKDTYSLSGVALTKRSDAFVGSRNNVPENGFSVETLSGLILPSGGLESHFLGQQTYHYLMQSGKMSFPPRMLYTDDVVFDDATLQVYENVMENSELQRSLSNAGYLSVARAFDETGKEAPVWAARRAIVNYHGAEKFYLPMKTQETLLSGESLLTYDANSLRVLSNSDALGNKTSLSINPLSLSVWSLIDSNLNTKQVALTPLGFPAQSSFYGNELGVVTGFDALKEGVTSPSSVSDLLEESEEKVLRFATKTARNLFAWSDSQQPLHQVSIVADTFPEHGPQQIRTQVTHSDGVGRVLQVAQRVEPGLAYCRKEDGKLMTDEENRVIELYSDTRWQVTGSIEYNNKGLAVKQYPPYFVDDWRYVTSKELESIDAADTYFYDALNRITKVVTAKGYERRHYYTPWGSILEDENDTWSTVTTN